MKALRSLSLTLLAVSGCCTIRGYEVRDVKFTSKPDGATVTVKSDGGTVFTGKTPTIARLKAGAGYFKPATYTVGFELPGCTAYETPIRHSLDWRLYGIGNLILGGIPGWIFVDPKTGAMWTLEREVHADLNPQ
jgi:hypothetical protein